jgi:hypothetical protein
MIMANKERMDFTFHGGAVSDLQRIAALLDLRKKHKDPLTTAVSISLNLAVDFAEETVIHGKVLTFLHPALLEVIKNNPEFFRRLAVEPELIERLEPFVAANPKPKTENTP